MLNHQTHDSSALHVVEQPMNLRQHAADLIAILGSSC